MCSFSLWYRPVILLVDGKATFPTTSGFKNTIPERMGFVVIGENMDKSKINCMTRYCGNYTLLELWTGEDFTESFINDTVYSVPWDTGITNTTSDYVTAPLGPAKNTYQHYCASNNSDLAPNFINWMESSKPTGTQA